ncbi:Uncharacterized protein dnm_009180 [Desulfonema magnum]|uniref:Uncharacterized protein n=1 Tax=Desulfonema magnum TaxID=45655 RepID=A0A975GKU6_9BACT|nr:Uncharacterized protein dnm_009180 [Desulfonema magnum]
MTRFEQKICHSCESRNPFLDHATVPASLDACFRRLRCEISRTERQKNLIIKFLTPETFLHNFLKIRR